jgi:hypothetical protein
VTPGDERARIVDVLTDYAWAIDSKNWDLLSNCFTEHCRVSYGNGSSPHPGGIQRFEDRATLVDYMSRTHGPLDASLHAMTNIRIDLVGPGSARARTYGRNTLVLKAHPDGPSYESLGYYEDELIEFEGQWRIDARRYTRVWAQGNGKVIQPCPAG